MKKRWIAVVLVAAGTVIICLSYNLWDIPIALYCRNLSRSTLDAAEIVTTAGEAKWYFMLCVPLFVLFRFIIKNKIRAMRMLFLFITISASGIVNTVLKWIAGRNRPINLFDYDFYGFNFFKVIYESNSFPSGHALTAFSVAAALSILYPRTGFIVFPAAIAIAASRVLLTVHFLSDVIAGAVIGTICTLAVKYYFDHFKIDLFSRAGEQGR